MEIWGKEERKEGRKEGRKENVEKELNKKKNYGKEAFLMRTGSIKKSQGEAYKIFKENISMRDAKKNGKIALVKWIDWSSSWRTYTVMGTFVENI